MADSYRFDIAKTILFESVHKADDLDEARGQVLTFLAVVTASVLEHGYATRDMHKVQLMAARELEQAQNKLEIQAAAETWLSEVGDKVFDVDPSASKHVERALEFVTRNYNRDLSDEEVARHLKISTSHFRHVFRKAMGQPFHKYLMAFRLEKARVLLHQDSLPIGQVASRVGFRGVAHFSRAFARRFNLSPREVRRLSLR